MKKICKLSLLLSNLSIFCLFGCSTENNSVSFNSETSQGGTSIEISEGEASEIISTNPSIISENSETSSEPIIIKSKFSKEIYSYNKFGGFECELPLDLVNARVHYVKVDGNFLDEKDFYFDDRLCCLVLSEDFSIRLTEGSHLIDVITDNENDKNLSCRLNVKQFLKTFLDDSINKEISLGKERDLFYKFILNGASIKSLLINENKISENLYYLNENGLVIDGNLVKKFPGKNNIEVILSNNDIYNLTFSTNVLFATDYDYHSEHSDALTTTGTNVLYQYSVNVDITDAPNSGEFYGKALKITPNTKDVLYDCNNYIDLCRKNIEDPFWTHVDYKNSANYSYLFDFDYFTENTTTGIFRFGTSTNIVGSGWCENLLLGETNNNVAHHFRKLVKGSDLGDRMSFYALFKGAQGNVYIDNFSIIEIEGYPELNVLDEYDSGNYVCDFDSCGMDFAVFINDTEINNFIYDINNKKLTIPSDIMGTFDTYMTSICIKTSIVNFDDVFFINKNNHSICKLLETTKNVLSTDTNVVFKGEFSNDLSITGVERFGTNASDGSNPDGKKIDKNFFGLSSNGLIVNNDLIKTVYGEELYQLSLSNGRTLSVSLNSNKVFYTDYNDFDIAQNPSGGNVGWCQDTTMISYEYSNGRRFLRYTPENAVEGHSKSALNDGTIDKMYCNGVYTFRNSSTYIGSQFWDTFTLGTDGSLHIKFVYKINSNGLNPNYSFGYRDVSTKDWVLTPLISDNQEHVFEMNILLEDFDEFAINCPAKSPSEVSGTYMDIFEYQFEVVK